MWNIGIVVIGRNEGKRLQRCIYSILDEFSDNGRIVYVDSGSTDESVAFCESLGLTIVELEETVNFTAALARNRGFEALYTKYPECDFVQFIDGDCALAAGWLSKAVKYLAENKHHAVVCGRRAEVDPSSSIYNTLCDIEWDTPVGLTQTCGGDSMMRCEAFAAVCGFNEKMIAGEEPELCFRLSKEGWLIERLDVPMTSHDANIHSFKQWSKRASRSGSAYAWGAALHGSTNEHYNVRELISILVWGGLIPLVLILMSFISNAVFLYGLLLYPVMILRISVKHAGRLGIGLSFQYALFIMIAKFYESKGVVVFCYRWLLNKTHTLIEYK